MTVNNLIYADDTVIWARTHEELQTLINIVSHSCQEYGLSLIAKTPQDIHRIYVNNHLIERVRVK